MMLFQNSFYFLPLLPRDLFLRYSHMFIFSCFRFPDTVQGGQKVENAVCTEIQRQNNKQIIQRLPRRNVHNKTADLLVF